MAHPKHKTSKARRDKRRTHWKLDPVNPSKCAQCGEAKLPHQVCPHCGYYNGRQVVEIKVKEE
ncbi:50S ribosomal protein L32 [bacterium]|nr:50S ribosomal protein L32 [bacterium]MBU1615159.1 50S ribosomal protein L32 [bacterium]